MNERIQALMDQCEEPYSTQHYPCWDMEKFAKLIVQECVKEIEFQYGGGSDQPMDNEWDRAIECVSSMIKYRFGVEE